MNTTMKTTRRHDLLAAALISALATTANHARPRSRRAAVLGQAVDLQVSWTENAA